MTFHFHLKLGQHMFKNPFYFEWIRGQLGKAWKDQKGQWGTSLAEHFPNLATAAQGMYLWQKPMAYLSGPWCLNWAACELTLVGFQNFLVSGHHYTFKNQRPQRPLVYVSFTYWYVSQQIKVKKYVQYLLIHLKINNKHNILIKNKNF